MIRIFVEKKKEKILLYAYSIMEDVIIRNYKFEINCQLIRNEIAYIHRN